MFKLDIFYVDFFVCLNIIGLTYSTANCNKRKKKMEKRINNSNYLFENKHH